MGLVSPGPAGGGVWVLLVPDFSGVEQGDGGGCPRAGWLAEEEVPLSLLLHAVPASPRLSEHVTTSP